MLSTIETPLPARQLADPAPGAAIRRSRARAALRLADELLDRLERLELEDQEIVPSSLSELIATVVRAATRAGIDPPSLASQCAVMRLMDDVYDLEGKLLPRCRRRVYPPLLPSH